MSTENLMHAAARLESYLFFERAKAAAKKAQDQALEDAEQLDRRKWLASVKAEAAQTGRSIDDIAKERPWDKQ